jgi:hypothetical protein
VNTARAPAKPVGEELECGEVETTGSSLDGNRARNAPIGPDGPEVPFAGGRNATVVVMCAFRGDWKTHSSQLATNRPAKETVYSSRFLP